VLASDLCWRADRLTLSAERNEPIDLPLSNEAMAGISEMTQARR
jgi:hypothetical protein